jgi:hypothetical protein
LVWSAPPERARSGKATETLQESLHKVKHAAQTIVDEIAGMPQRPQSMSVQFGVKLTAETGAVITRAGGEANFVLTLGWSAAADESQESRSGCEAGS